MISKTRRDGRYRRLTLNRSKRASLVISLEVLDLLAHDQGQLNLEMEVDALGLNDWAIARQEDGRWRLEEEEGLFGPLVVQLRHMVPDDVSV